MIATCYGLDLKTVHGSDLVSICFWDTELGGVQTQAAITAGHSGGRESNPLNRGAWLAGRTIGWPPDAPR